MLIRLEGITEVAVERDRLTNAVKVAEKAIGKLERAVNNPRFAANNPELHAVKKAQYDQEQAELKQLKLGMTYLPEGA